MSTANLSHCRIVLVRPHYAGNLGATARVMRNFGLSDLVLVAPYASTNDLEARRMATHGLSVLDAARAVPELGHAVADCVFTLATSGLAAGVVRETFVGTPEEKLPALLAAMASGPVALVFGPEPSGLSNAEISRCHYLIHIPTDPAYPALNLAQAVAICLYELRRLWLHATPPIQSPEPIAPFVEQERMFEKLQEGLEQIHFLYGDKADSLMHALRHLIARAGPTAMEVDVLFGLARQLRWIAAQSNASEPDA